jgi:hypothetical protein
MNLFEELSANKTYYFIDLPLIVLMLLENLKSKKTKNVCVEIWLHPLHPLFKWSVVGDQ